MRLNTQFTVPCCIFFLFVTGIIFTGCRNNSASIEDDQKQISAMLDSFNLEAARADYSGYFNNYTSDAIFIGTDATERWDKDQFMVWAKPYFDKGKAWNFRSIERHIYINENKNTAWFDELLNTQMKICRGSGVLVKKDNEWKIQQYVLSMTMPNNQINEALKLKTPMEDSIINSFQMK